MKIIVLSQLYRSKSATLGITYDMKNWFLIMYYLFPHQTTEFKQKIVCTLEYIMIEPRMNLSELQYILANDKK